MILRPEGIVNDTNQVRGDPLIEIRPQVPREPQIPAGPARIPSCVLTGNTLYNFALYDLNGQPWEFRHHQGRLVLLDFWATWCPPCVKSLPELEQIHQQSAGQTVKIFAVNLQENETRVRSFLQSRGLSLPILMDSEGEVAQKYSIHAIPQTVIIGKNGEVQKVFVGASPETPDKIRAEIESVTGQVSNEKE